MTVSDGRMSFVHLTSPWGTSTSHFITTFPVPSRVSPSPSSGWCVTQAQPSRAAVMASERGVGPSLNWLELWQKYWGGLFSKVVPFPEVAVSWM